MSGGRVVVLNGASSAGKSSLAAALQAVWEAAGMPWVIFSWDDFVPRLPDRWRGVPAGIGDRAADGCSYRVVEAEPVAALLEVGDEGRRLLAGYHRSVAALARAGVNVLVEEVMITTEEWDDWQDALAGLDVRWVGVRCDVEVVVAREVARGDRYPGLARGTTAVVHAHATYDVEVDTSSSSPEVLAAELAHRLDG